MFAAMWLLAAMIEGQFCLLFGFLGLLGVQVALVSERTRNQPLVLDFEGGGLSSV